MEKEDICFSKHRYKCKECVAIYNKQYQVANAEQIAKTHKNYQEKNKEQIAENHQQYYQNHREELLEVSKDYYQNNKVEIVQYQSQYYQDNKEHIKQQARQYQQDNKEQIKAKNKTYRQNNKKSINTYHRNRRQSDPNYKLRTGISSIISAALKLNGGSKKGRSILEHLSYTIQELKTHLEKQFLEPNNEWMSWNNHGKYDPETWDDLDSTTWTWQLDHIEPHSTFHYTSMEDDSFKKCWALSNLRPYSAKLNQIEGATKIRHKKEDGK
jgi:hypothetical protein